MRGGVQDNSTPVSTKDYRQYKNETASFKKGIGASREVLETFKQYREYINNPKFKSIEAKEKYLSTINSSKFELSPHDQMNLKRQMLGKTYMDKAYPSDRQHYNKPPSARKPAPFDPQTQFT